MRKQSIIKRGVSLLAIGSASTFGLIGAALVTAAPAHAVAVCMDEDGPVDGIGQHCDASDDAESLGYAVTVEVAEPGTADCPADDTGVNPDGGVGMAECPVDGTGVEVYMTGALPAPQGEAEACAVVVGCTGIESSTSDDGDPT